MDTTAFLAAVDFSTVGAGIAAIAALLVVPKVVKYGFRKLLGMIPG